MCSQILRNLAELIRLPALRPPVVLGLATSVGGLDAQLASAAGSALVDAVSAAAPGSSTLVEDAAEGGAPLLLGVADCVLAISSREPRCVLGLPLSPHQMVLNSRCCHALQPGSAVEGWVQCPPSRYTAC